MNFLCSRYGNILNLEAPTPQNGQTHFADELFEYV